MKASEIYLKKLIEDSINFLEEVEDEITYYGDLRAFESMIELAEAKSVDAEIFKSQYNSLKQQLGL